MGSKHVRMVNKGFNLTHLTYRHELWKWEWDVKTYQQNIDRIAEYRRRLRFECSDALAAFYENRIENAVKQNEELKAKWPKYLT